MVGVGLRSGRGWGSGAQHSQAIQGLLMGVPGLKIVMPSTPADAKGLLLSAIADNNPVLVFEHRWLMKKDGIVPEGFYQVPIGKGVYRRRGKDVTVVGASHAIELAGQAANQIRKIIIRNTTGILHEFHSTVFFIIITHHTHGMPTKAHHLLIAGSRHPDIFSHHGLHKTLPHHHTDYYRCPLGEIFTDGPEINRIITIA
ncbi:hypothetical protein [Mycobacterium tuberculosis]|uniref:hypothetical protein n=1 Tax=Mycobacterium tuberculosis TaxID=1773 RepID=UPI00350FD7C7